MTNIEAQNKLSTYLASNSILFRDKLGQQHTVRSYEDLIAFIELNFRAYSGKISEYETEYRDLKNKLAEILKSIKENENIVIANIVRSVFSFTYYGNNVDLKSISVDSLSDEPGRTLDNILQIYEEHGMDALNNYIELLNNPSFLNSYLNDRNKQVIAMKYLLFSTGHHSSRRLSRNLTAKKFFEEFKKNYNEVISDVTSKKEEYSTFLNNKRSEYDEWFNNKSNELNDFFEEAKNKRQDLERTYSTKLKIEKPANYMETKSDDYKKSFIMWSVAAVVLSVIVIVLLGLILSPELVINEKIVELKFFSKEMPVYSSIIIVAIISLIIYVIRVFIKVALSAKHISEEYKQKHVLTYFYLSLLNDGKIDKEIEKFILMSLFEKADTGLIKYDNNSNDFLFDFINKNTK